MSSYANLLAYAVDRMTSLRQGRDKEERLQLALNAGELGTWELDLASGAATHSARHDEIFGYDAPLPAWTLDAFWSHVLAQDRDPVARAYRHAMETATEWRFECRIRRAGEGEIRWIDARGRPAGNDGGGRPTHMLGIVADITERKAAEDTLRRSNEVLEARVDARTRALSEANARLTTEAAERERVEDALRQSHKMEAVGQLTGGIAHDINNMLQAIGGGLELMSRRVEQGRAADAARLVEGARKTVERAAALTNRLLAFSRRQALQPSSLEPDTLVRGMVELIQHMAGPAVTVEVCTRDGAWAVLCDPNQLESALLNLAINARDAMPDGGTLSICTRDVSLSAADTAGQEGVLPGDYVEIAVADTGMGMDEATRTRAFEPFFTTKPIGQGTGLGLSQLYGFARQSGGTACLDSVPGQGTTARLYLPRHAPIRDEDAPSVAEPAPYAAPAGDVVLLVEDEVQIRGVVAETLRDVGYEVLEAGDGPAALQVFQGRLGSAVNLLVTDVGLPGALNGRQLADAVRATRPSLPVLFITGYAGSVLDNQLAPGMAVIGKPFALDAIIAKIRSMAEGTSKLLNAFDKQ